MVSTPIEKEPQTALRKIAVTESSRVFTHLRKNMEHCATSVSRSPGQNVLNSDKNDNMMRQNNNIRTQKNNARNNKLKMKAFALKQQRTRLRATPYGHNEHNTDNNRWINDVMRNDCLGSLIKTISQPVAESMGVTSTENKAKLKTSKSNGMVRCSICGKESKSRTENKEHKNKVHYGVYE